MCEECLALVPAKILLKDGKVFYEKRCLEHGVQETLVSTDPAYWASCATYAKPGDMPLEFQTEPRRGCPYDCGLCPDHEQHSCLALLEITDHCDLRCPTCFASSGPERLRHRPMEDIERMLDTLVASEGVPDLVQISGGEPTTHPCILDILRAAKARPIRHLMLNTNGLRIASDPTFADALAEIGPGFEVYLQCDSLRDDALKLLRNAALARIHEKALLALDARGISTTLVATIRKGVNDQDLGEIIRYGLSHPCVRGVTFQPVQDVGRNEGFKKEDRILLSEIRRGIIEQSHVFAEEDLLPLPCNPKAIGVAYALRTRAPSGDPAKDEDSAFAVSGLIPKEVLMAAPNAITYETHPKLREIVMSLLSLSCNGEASAKLMGDLLCCLPKVEMPAAFTYDKVFRVAIVSFLDRFSFCLGDVKRSCVHVVQDDGRLIPLDTYNLLHRKSD